LLFSFTTVNDKGLLPAKAAAGIHLPAYVAPSTRQWEFPKDSRKKFSRAGSKSVSGFLAGISTFVDGGELFLSTLIFSSNGETQ